jgi:hypothetical protein
MKAYRIKAATRALEFGDMRHRFAVTCLMVVSLLLAGFLNTSSAHAAFDSDKAVAEQVVDGKAPGSAHTDVNAPHGKTFGGDAACTGHCASHTVTLPAPIGLLLAFIEPTAAWPAWTATFVVAATASRLDRPPRA